MWLIFQKRKQQLELKFSWQSALQTSMTLKNSPAIEHQLTSNSFGDECGQVATTFCANLALACHKPGTNTPQRDYTPFFSEPLSQEPLAQLTMLTNSNEIFMPVQVGGSLFNLQGPSAILCKSKTSKENYLAIQRKQWHSHQTSSNVSA